VGVVIETSAPSAMPSGSGAVSDVEVYDFGRPATLSREHARLLEVAFETFSRQWAAQLSAKIGVRAHVSVELVAMRTYDDYAASLPATTTLVVCALPETEERVIIQFPLSAGLAWIIQMVGGRPLGEPDERPFTPIEQALIRALMVDATENLTNALGGLLPHGLTINGIQYSSQFAQVAAASELVIAVHFSMRLGDRTIPASVMLPASLVLERLTTQDTEKTDAATPAMLHRQVEATPVDLTLRLAPRAVRPQEVLSLSIGDIVGFPHSADRPLDLVVDDHIIATAAVGTSGARLACVITATPSDPAEESS
jgi:flagellar motor switch protein FliM